MNALKEKGVVEKLKFSPISCCISEMVQDGTQIAVDR